MVALISVHSTPQAVSCSRTTVVAVRSTMLQTLQ